MRYIFSILLVVSLPFSVTPVVHGFIAYEQYGMRYDILMWKVHSDHWNIGYRYASNCPAGETSKDKELEEAITASLQMWLQPLRALKTAKPIVNDFRYKKNADLSSTDMRVTFHCVGRQSNASIHNMHPPDVSIREGTTVNSQLMSVLVHEIGHAFGMADTYLGSMIRDTTPTTAGGLSDTVGTQPPSMMSFHLGNFYYAKGDEVDLGEDDKRGIIWLYKYLFDDNCFLPDGSRIFPPLCNYNFLKIDDCLFSDYVFEEEPRGCVPKYPLIFETKHNPTIFALKLLKDDPTVDVKAQDESGMTALHYAVMYEKEEVVKALLAHKDIRHSLKNKQGETPLDIALATNNSAIIEMFPDPPRRKEDVNGDGEINILDLVAVAAKFGQKDAGTVDVNGDGAVDIRDLVLVAGAFGAAASAPAL